MNTTKILIIDDEIEFAGTLAERLMLRNFEALAVPGADNGLWEITSWSCDTS